MNFFRLLILSSLFCISCTSFVYQPDSFIYTDPQKLKPYLTQFQLDGPEGKIVVWQFKSPKSKPTQILFFHGNAQNISSHFYSLYWILEHGYDFVTFDYPGYGGSEGVPTQESVYRTSLVVYEWMKKNNPDKKISFLGQSLGGNIAAYTAAQVNKNPQNAQNLCLVTLDSTFLSYKTVAKRTLSQHWLTWPLQWMGYLFVAEDYSAKYEIKNIAPTPLIVMHGDADRAVAFENGKDVFAAAAEPKEFWLVEGGHHIDGFTGANRRIMQNKYLTALSKHCD